MKFLRSAPTGRLLAVLAVLVVAVVGGGAIAVAASGSGPVPKPRSLASALHRALAAPAVRGISADVTFTNNLIDASSVPGSDPLLKGASGRLWLSGDHRLRLELQSAGGDAQIVVDKSSFWISDPAQQIVYEGTLPRALISATGRDRGAGGVPSIATIQRDLSRLLQHVNASGAIPGNLAGRPAYTVRVTPRHDGGLLGAVEVAWDAVRGVPLRFAVYARGNPNPILELAATNISYGSIPASDLNVAPPAGSKVVKISTAAVGGRIRARAGRHLRFMHRAPVRGVRAVAARLPFALRAPSTLIGMPRQSVRLLSWGGRAAALLTYGKGLGGLAVIEQTAAARPSATGGSGSGGQTGLSLPTVSINGATGTELDTALGTLLRFSRAGVGYTVIGSVPPVAAETAARAL